MLIPFIISFSEGYEKLARAKGEDTSLHSGEGNSYLNGEGNLLSDGQDLGVASSIFTTTSMGTSKPHLASAEVSGNDADEYDMFADDDEHAATKPSTDENNAVSEPSSDAINSGTEGKNIASINLASEMEILLLICIC